MQCIHYAIRINNTRNCGIEPITFNLVRDIDLGICRKAQKGENQQGKGLDAHHGNGLWSNEGNPS